MYMFVEERIKKAMDQGEFDNLPGKGKPLNLEEDLQGLSPELRMGYRILKNAGYIDDKLDDNKKDLTMVDLLYFATGTSQKDDMKTKLEFEEFVQNKDLHRNPRFRDYARKIYQKLFL
ncbi:DUF1992 domain-containing protein [Virgibacillus xinjiangensis]|uniref:DUF1992 domain-containing protein n=1 Tax=Virgibacillus xinjiangensis TaxID=393090 RepID=A0ABV7CZL1_9BACI